jgi:hypothetical protein
MAQTKHTPGAWEWDGNVWDYNPEQEAPWLVNQDGDRILSGEIKCHKEADAHLIAAAPELKIAGSAQTNIIKRAQIIMTAYLTPEGPGGMQTINQLLELLDGPDQRAALAMWDTAIARAEGRS